MLCNGASWKFVHTSLILALGPFQNFHTSLVFVLGPRLIFGWCEADKYIPDTEIGLPFRKTYIPAGLVLGRF